MTSLTLAQAVWPRHAQSQAINRGRDILLAVGFSLVTALTAQVAIPLPFTPVPITGQTFGVLLTGALLGSRLGAATLLLYLAEGLVGLPFFAGGTAGYAKIIGPTGGYLLSYPIAAFLIGLLAERGWDRRPMTMLLGMLLSSVVIFACGALQLAHFVGLSHAFTVGVLPFLPGDAIKALLAAALLPTGWKCLKTRHG